MRAFRLAYDGTHLYGFQRQPDVPTVESTLLDALRRLDVLAADADTPPGYAAAGRTDRGVSAVAQTIAFECPDWLTPAAFNSELPETVRVWAHADVPDDFHATHLAHERGYTYHLTLPDGDADLLADACDRLRGEHDFHNLTPDQNGTVRAIDIETEWDGEYCVLQVTSDGFPRQLVRRLVGLIAAVATEERPLDFLDRVLSNEVLDGPDGVAPAPPEPLVLTRVEYPDVTFAPDPDAVVTAQQIFDDRRIRRQTGARVARTLRDGVE